MAVTKEVRVIEAFIRQKKWLWPVYGFVLYMLAFPRFNMWPLAFVSLVPVLLYIEQEPKRWRACVLPGLAAMIPAGYFGYGLCHYSVFYFLIMVMVQALAIGMVALLWRLIISAGRRLSPRLQSLWILLGIPMLWVVYEHVRVTLPIINITSVGLLGYSQVLNTPLLQWASVTGVLGLSFIVVMVNSALFLLVRPIAGGAPRARSVSYAALGLTVLIMGWGVLRIMTFTPAGEMLKAGVVQPNIPLGVYWDASDPRATGTMRVAAYNILDTMRSLTEEAAAHGADVIVWPERSFFGDFNAGDKAYGAAEVRAMVQKAGVPAIIGGLYAMDTGGEHNSAYLLSADDGTIVSRYDKINLVPFGETIPGGRAIEGGLIRSGSYRTLEKVFSGSYEPTPQPWGEGRAKPFSLADFLGVEWLIPGTDYVLFPLKGVPAAPLICDEDMLLPVARECVQQGARVLIIMTNDAWFGTTAFVYHHFFCSVMRAVENGVSVIRSANTGVSGIITPTGKLTAVVHDQRGCRVGVRGVAVGPVPVASGRTLYVKAGYAFPYVCVWCGLILLVLSVIFRFYRKKAE